MDYTSIKVGQLPTGEISGGNFIPHEVAGVLKKATFTDLAAFIGASDAVGFRAVSVQNGGTLPTTDTQEFILVGPGTYNNVGGGSTITVTEELNALVSNGTYWFVGVEIPIDAPPGNAIWGQIIGTLSNQTDLKNILDLKADLVDGKVPASQLPSYVDDIIEVANYAALPTTGETGKIYLTLDNNKIYRWSGSIYIEIAAENAVWGQIVGTLSNQTDLQSALNLRVPYTGATANVDLGTHTLSSKNLVVNHASGSGVAAQITKGGNGEALTVSKTSGTGNAASILGGVTLLSELHLNTDLADAYIASAATWNAKQNALNGTGFVKISGTTISYDNTSYLPLTGGTMSGQIVLKEASSSTDFTKGLRFPNDPFGGTSDISGIRLYQSGVLENQVLEIYIGNDSGDDIINFRTGSNPSVLSNNDVKINGNTIWNAGNLPSPFTLPSLTSGSILFSNGSTIAQNNSNLFWDNTNNRLAIGTTSPSRRLSVQEAGTSTSGNVIGVRNDNSTSGAYINFIAGGNNAPSIGAKGDDLTFTADGYNGAERMRITSGGDLAFGKQSVNWTLDGLQTEGQGKSIGVTNANAQNNLFLRKNDTTGNIAAFYYNSTAVGTISITSSSTSYNTSSDYRLKEDLKPMVNSLERLQNLKPVNFAWKSTGERVDGFIAHELAEVIPEAVTGEKDATEEIEVSPEILDEDGNVLEQAVFETREVYQGIDQSKIVPLLVAAMQELKAELDLLKAK
jgi:hypothetical protein